MLYVPITLEMRFKALERKCKSLEIYIKQKKSGYNSVLDKNDSWYSGGLGEAIFEKEFPMAKYADRSGYDHIIQNLKTDMKLTRRTSMRPNPRAFLLIPESEAERGKYCFVFGWTIGLPHREVDGWLLGWLPCRTFLTQARLRQRGECQDETGFIYLENSYEIRVEELYPIQTLLDEDYYDLHHHSFPNTF